MTPQEWLANPDPVALLAVVDPGAAQVEGVWQAPPPRPSMLYRRLRLFATACARSVWPFLTTDFRSAIVISERYADGLATESDLRAAFVTLTIGPISFVQHAQNAAGYASASSYSRNAREFPQTIDGTLRPHEAAQSAAYALATYAAGPSPRRQRTPQKWHDDWNAAFHAARAKQAAMVRDIFPPPGLAPRLEADWLTDTAVSLARQMDESDDFSPVPILADALQDAGCDLEPVLQCCRAPENVHVRGNWVVDLVLGKQ